MLEKQKLDQLISQKSSSFLQIAPTDAKQQLVAVLYDCLIKILSVNTKTLTGTSLKS